MTTTTEPQYVYVVTQQPDVRPEERHVVCPEGFPAEYAALGLMQGYRRRDDAVAAMFARCPADRRTEQGAALYGNYRVDRRHNNGHFIID